MHVCVPCECHKWNYGWLRTIMWVLGKKSRSSQKNVLLKYLYFFSLLFPLSSPHIPSHYSPNFHLLFCSFLSTALPLLSILQPFQLPLFLSFLSVIFQDMLFSQNCNQRYFYYDFCKTHLLQMSLTVNGSLSWEHLAIFGVRALCWYLGFCINFILSDCLFYLMVFMTIDLSWILTHPSADAIYLHIC